LIGTNIVDLSILLRREDDVVLLLGHRGVDRRDALLATDPERYHQLGENDRFAQWHEREVAREQCSRPVGGRGLRLGGGHLSRPPSCLAKALIWVVRDFTLSAFGRTSS